MIALAFVSLGTHTRARAHVRTHASTHARALGGAHLPESGQLLGGISLALEDEERCRQGSLRRDAPCWQPASWLEERGANH